jgi:hypothetical protein
MIALRRSAPAALIRKTVLGPQPRQQRAGLALPSAGGARLANDPLVQRGLRADVTPDERQPPPVVAVAADERLQEGGVAGLDVAAQADLLIDHRGADALDRLDALLHLQGGVALPFDGKPDRRHDRQQREQEQDAGASVK